MKRREFLRKSGMGLAGLALLRASGGGLFAEEKAAPKRPANFLFILTDQQRWDAVGASGNKYMHTATLDRLCKEGVRFHNCYVAQALCSPSRASIMSGLYPHAHSEAYRRAQQPFDTLRYSGQSAPYASCRP